MREKGFTLIELMVVVVILGVLAAIAIPFYNNYIFRSRTAEATVNINAIRTLQESWFAENNTYITTATGTACCAAAPAGAPGKQTRNWTGAETLNWGVLGFAPTGASTYYTYSVNCTVVATVCNPANVTIGAEGDLDGADGAHTFALATGTGVIVPTIGFTTNITPATFGTIAEGGAGVF